MLHINWHCCSPIETSQLICTANYLTGFYMRATQAINGLKEKYGITDDVEYRRCHRIFKQSNRNRPQTVICKATKYKNKQKILKNARYLKDTVIYIDFCKETMELQKKIWNQVL